MRVGSLFAGIGGFDLGLERAGMQVAWQVEIDPYAQSVLARHWPGVRRYDDVRSLWVDAAAPAPVDVLCGGFPCQDVSVAGRRAGLAGARSGLWTEFRRIIAAARPAWVLVENVPGLLSSRRGRDFGAVLRDLGQLGYGWAYRVLDAQGFGVPQARRRVFLVGRAGGGVRAAAQVLLEPDRLPWDFATRGAPQAAVARTLTGGAHGDRVSPPGRRREDDENLVAYQCKGGDVGPAGTLRSGDDVQGGVPFFEQDYAVRRLTPRECERVQGFPDDWSRWAADGRELSDSRRYFLIGNAVVPAVAEWIGRRIAESAGAAVSGRV